MNLHITYKHMPSSEALTNFTQDVLATRIAKFSRNPISLDITFDHQHHQNLMHGKLIDEKGSVVVLSESHEDMYKCVDIFSHKLERSLRKLKNKQHSYKHSRIPIVEENTEDN